MEEIDLDTHDQMLIDAQAAYDATIGTIDSLIAEAKAEVNISDWTANTISAADRKKMAAAINKEIAAGDALLVSANAQVQALFEGSSLEQAVLGMYGDLTSKIKANNAEINELLTAWLEEDDGAAYEKAMAKHEENKKLLAIATGGLIAEGKINKALMAIGDATPEEITNFAKGYNETLSLMTEGYIERGEERENVLYNMPDSFFAEQGKTRKQMIAENKAETNAAIAQANAMLLQSAADAMIPQLKRLMDNAREPGEVMKVKDMIFEVLSAVDYSNLNEGGKKAVQSLVNLMDSDKVRYMFGSDTNFFGTIDPYLRQIYRENYGKGGGVPMPNTYRVGDDNTPPAWYSQPRLPLTQYYDPMAYENKGYKAPPKLTQYYNPMAYENKGYKDLVFSGADITISNPRMKYPSMPDGYAGRGGSFDVNVDIAPLTINAAIELDGTTLGRATITAQQTVVKNTGVGGGGGTYFSIREP
jgi:hypothetical protein